MSKTENNKQESENKDVFVFGKENYKFLFGILLVGAGLTNAFIYNGQKKEK